MTYRAPVEMLLDWCQAATLVSKMIVGNVIVGMKMWSMQQISHVFWTSASEKSQVARDFQGEESWHHGSFLIDLSSNKPQHLKLYEGFPSRHTHLALQQDASVYLRLHHYSSAYTRKINFMFDFQARSEDSNWSVSWLLKMQISGFKLSGLTKSQDPAWQDRHI